MPRTPDQDPTQVLHAGLPTVAISAHDALVDQFRQDWIATETARLALTGALSDASNSVNSLRKANRYILELDKVTELPSYQQAALAEALTTRAIVIDTQYWSDERAMITPYQSDEVPLMAARGSNEETAGEYFVRREQELRPIAEAIERKKSAETAQDGTVMAMVFERPSGDQNFSISMHGIWEIAAAHPRPMDRVVHVAFRTANFLTEYDGTDRKIHGSPHGIMLPFDYYTDNPYGSDAEIVRRRYVIDPSELTEEVIKMLTSSKGPESTDPESVVLLGEDVVSEYMIRLGESAAGSEESVILREMLSAEEDPHGIDELYNFANALLYMTPNTDAHVSHWNQQDHLAKLQGFASSADRVWQQLLTGDTGRDGAQEDQASLEACVDYCIKNPKEGTSETAVESVVVLLGKKLEAEGVGVDEVLDRQQSVRRLLVERIKPLSE